MYSPRLVLWLLCGLLLTAAAPLRAQTDLTLEELVAQAIEQNYQLRIIRNSERSADNNNTIGNAGMLPQLSVLGERRTAINNSQQLFFTGDTQEATNARRNSTSASLEANWIVFDGFAMFGRKDRFEQLAAQSRADTRFLVEQTVADLMVAYYQLKQATRLLTTYEQALTVSQARVDLKARGLEVGASNRLDLQLAQVDRNTDSSLVLTQRAQVRELTIAINALINRDLTTPIQPTDSISLREEYELSSLLRSAMNNNAALSQQNFNELIALSDAKIARGAFYPTVELFGNFAFDQQANEVGFLASSRTFGPTYGVRVRFNLYSGRQAQIQEENANIAVETEQLRSEDLQQSIEQALRVAYLRWDNHREQVQLERQSVRAAGEALSIARRQYELGAITNVDFRVIQLNAINAETRFLEAQFQAKLREIELLRLSGQLLR